MAGRTHALRFPHARRWRARVAARAFALVAAVGILAAGAAGAQTPQADAHRLAIASKRVPLPPGDWHLLAQSSYPAAGRRTGVAAEMRSVVLAQTVGGRLLALVVVRTNLNPAEGGFGIAEDCRRSDVHLARIDTPRGSSLAGCTFIAHVLHDTAPTADPAWREALAQIAARQLQAPPLWLEAGFRFADEDDVFDVRYLFDPTLLGLQEPPLAPAGSVQPQPDTGVIATMRGWVGLSNGPPPGDPRWRASSWYPSTSAQDARRTWVIAQLATWADQVRGDVRRGFKGRDVEPLPWPVPWARAFRIEPPAQAQQPGAAGNGVAAAPPLALPEGPEMTALWKTFSWRAVGSFLDMAVSYVFTGSATIATGITVVGGFVNATAYFVHEMVWSSNGNEGGPADATTELPPIGIGS